MCVGSCHWAGITYPHYTVMMSPKKDKTAVHCCYPALLSWFLSCLVSQNNIEVSALQFILRLYIFVFWLIRSLVDPMLAAFIVCGPLQFLVSNLDTFSIGIYTCTKEPASPNLNE